MGRLRPVLEVVLLGQACQEEGVLILCPLCPSASEALPLV